MSGFSSRWLDLREPADARSRAHDLSAPLVRWLAARPPVRVLDLGCGTGANLRWLAPRLGGPQTWRLLDRDAALLAALPRRVEAWARNSGLRSVALGDGLQIGDSLSVRWQRLDLAADVLPLSGHVLVTASALADLVSVHWLRALARGCAAAGCAVLLSLSYDGRLCLLPRVAGDAALRDALNRHQLRDKGFGPALGPDAAAAVTNMLRRLGYRVTQARSDWCLGAADGALQAALLRGWVDAWRELADVPAEEVAQWLARRLHHLEGGCSRMTVGHVDLLALPPERTC